MKLFKCLVPVLVLLLVEGSSATWCQFRKFALFHVEGSPLHRMCHPKPQQQDRTSAPPTVNEIRAWWNRGGAGPSTFGGNRPAYGYQVPEANSASNAVANAGSSGVGGSSVGNGNAAANAEATATANSETTSGTTGKNEPQNPLHVEGLQAPGVNGNGQGNWHPDGETTAAIAVSQNRVNPFRSQPGRWILGPFVAANAGGGAGPSGVGGSSVGNGNAAANAEATATANSETTSGSTADAVSNANRQAGAYAEYNDYPATGQQPAVMVQNGGSIVLGNGRVISIGIYNGGSSGTFEAQNPLHVQGPQAPGVNGNGQGNEHPDGETTAAIAVSQSRVNHSLSQPGQWIFVPFVAANAEGGAGPSTFGGYGPAYGGRVPGANSASNAGANAGSSGVGGSSVGNGYAAANAEATPTANSETTSGSTGKIESQNPLHVEGLQAPAVNGNGQGNEHPDGETTAAIAVSQSRVNHSLSQPGQWIFVPFVAANAEGGAGPSTFGGYGPAYGGRVPGANSASNAGANAGSSGVGGSSVGNGYAAANAEATPTANSETTSGSTGKIESQNPLHVEGPQAPAVNGNVQGNGHPDGEITAAPAVSQSRADGEATATANSETTSGSTGIIESQNPLHVEGPQAPAVNGNGQGNGHPDGETTAAPAVSQSRADGEATATANSETTSGSTGIIEAQNPLHVEGPQAPAVNGNGQGNEHPDGETTAAIAVSQSRADGEATATANSETTSGSTGIIESQNPLHIEGPQAPVFNGNGQGNWHLDGETTAATAVSQSRADGEATATANSETTSGSTGIIESQNPLHIEGPQAPVFNGNGQGNWHLDGETTAATAVSQSRADGEATATANSETTSGSTGIIESQNPLHVEGPQAPGVIGNGQGNWHPDGETTAANPFRSQPGQWIFVPFEAANGGGGAGPSTFGGYGPAYGGRVPGANSASNAGANAGSSGVGGSSVGNGNAAANAEATVTANSETTSGSTADAVSNTNRQGSSGGLSRAISIANSNASGGSTSSSSKSTANGSGVKSSAFRYASASAGANV